MKRPDIEDYHQDRTGEDLLNPPYNRLRYSIDLNKYIDHLEEEKEKLTEKIKEAYTDGFNDDRYDYDLENYLS